MTKSRDFSRLAKGAASKVRSRVDDIVDSVAPDASMVFTNVEHDARYSFELPMQRLVPGVTAMLRAKNEVDNVPLVLPEILPLFDEVVFIDNGSTDGTLGAVADIVQHHEFGDRITLAAYPFSIARCGDEHWNTPEDSVKNLAYFYNWCLSQCSFDYVFKWDLDMVPIPGQTEALATAFASIDHAANELWRVRCQTIYKAPDGRWLAANNEINQEPRLHPNKAQVRYRKAKQWEALEPDIELELRSVQEPCIYELKDTSVDEFDHWTNTQDLSPRKQVEYANYCAVRDGTFEQAQFTELGRDQLPNTLT